MVSPGTGERRAFAFTTKKTAYFGCLRDPCPYSVYNSPMNLAKTETPSKRTFRGGRDALVQKVVDEPDLSWRLVVTLNTVRLLISLTLLGLFFASAEPRVFGDSNPALFSATVAGYFVFAILSAVSLRMRWVPIRALGVTLMLVDIVAIVILTHASGGIASGLGGLLVIFIGAGSLVVPFKYPAVLPCRQPAAQDGQRRRNVTLRQLLGSRIHPRSHPTRRRGRPHRHGTMADVADKSRSYR